ncbi:MAG TPA: PD-(D/E)XK nuclease family protein [Candidatus Saccharimonadales bacterium]|nr:PD-(D/E)XK nuclease family protein [Candidatus Saccharimonadales bacterium]
MTIDTLVLGQDLTFDRSKIIAIHTSDRATFKQCRRKWDWSSPTRRNLRPLGGISFPLWFGTGMHKALEEYRHPGLQRDPVEAFYTWYYDELSRMDTTIVELNSQELLDHLEMGVSMLTHYRDEVTDQYEVLYTEQAFAIPLGFQVDGKEVTYCGRMDAIVRDRETGDYGIIDYKTTSNMDDLFSRLDLDEQATSYLYVGTQLVDLPLSFIVYVGLLKGTIREPTITSRGVPSLDRTKEYTTPELFMECVVHNELEEWYANSEPAQLYYEFLTERKFVEYKVVRRNATQLQNAFQRIVAEAKEMTDPSLVLYPNPSGNYSCLKCPFRAPCLAMEDGSDYEFMLTNNYRTNMVDGRYT